MSTSPSTASSLSESYEEASDFNKYRLRVTAGPDYDSSTHVLVPVNSPETITFENDHVVMSLAVRIQGFNGFPDNSPESCSYFEHALHKNDQYSISFSFIPKQDINGDDLVFGNDFDRPIRDRLPPGFKQAMRIVKWWVDPGLDGDPYADKPYLYGTALSSWNYFRIGEKILFTEEDNKDEKEEDEEKKVDNEKVEKVDKEGKEPFPSLNSTDEDAKTAWKLHHDDSFHNTVIEEGAEGSGKDTRTERGLPDTSAARMKYFLTQANRENFVFEKGRQYQADFGNAYLNFNDFSLKLPGFSIRVIRYVDSKTHELRYVLKNRKTGEVHAVVMFTLLFGGQLKEETNRSRSSSLLSEQPPSATSHAAAKKALDANSTRSRSSSTASHKPSTPAGSSSNTTVDAIKAAEASDNSDSSTSKSKSSSLLKKVKKDKSKSGSARSSRSSSLVSGLKKNTAKGKDETGTRSRSNSAQPDDGEAESRPSVPLRTVSTLTEDVRPPGGKKSAVKTSDNNSIPSQEDDID